MRCILAVLFISFSTLSWCAVPSLKDGDIIFQTSKSSQSIAVQRATRSKFSHMGMVIYRNGSPFVFEAISTVQYTPLEKWISRGIGQHFVAKRLKNADAILTPASLKNLFAAAKSFTGRPYDLYFDWSDDRIYCSELVWKAYDRGLGIQIGALQKIKDFNLSDQSVKAKMHERYGKNIPLNETVISPVAMFESPLLVTIASR